MGPLSKLDNCLYQTKSCRYRLDGKRGVRSVENEEYGKCGVWKMRSVENAEYGKCRVCKMWSVENAEYSVWKCINFFIQHKKCLEMVYS